MNSKPEEITVNGLTIKLFREHADNFVKKEVTCLVDLAGVRAVWNVPKQFLEDRENFDKYIYKIAKRDIGGELFERALKSS